MSETMRHLVYGSGKLEWRETSRPKVEGPGEALVEPIAVATCDLDLLLFSGGYPTDREFPVGHEFVGRVLEVGEGVTSAQPGDVVAVSFQISCGSCEQCRRGLTGSCRTAGPGSMYGFEPIGGDWGGTLADVVRVPFANGMMFPLPPGVAPADVASLGDNFADGWRTVADGLARYPGTPVLVVGGLGMSVPFYAIHAAKALGAERVDYLDDDEVRLARAERLGAHPVEWTGARPGGYLVTVDGSGIGERLRVALESTSAGGTCTSVGIYWEDVPFPLFRMYSIGVTFVTGRVNSAQAIPELLPLAAAGDISPQLVTEHILDWEDAPQLLDADVKTVVVRS